MKTVYSIASTSSESARKAKGGLAAFSAGHHDIPLSNLRRLAEVGLEVWLAEQEARYRCPACSKPVDIHSETCRACGAELPQR